MFGAGVGIVAGFLAATFHFHLLYSRIALNNVGDMLFLPLMLWLIDRGIGGRRRVESLLAGITIGLGQYYFFGARLLPVVAIVVVAATALDSVGWRRGRLDEGIRSFAPYTLLLVVGAVIAATPFLANYIDHGNEVLARQRQVSIFGSGWLGQEGTRTGKSAVEIVIGQVWRAALVPFHTPVSGTYATPVPFAGSSLAIPIAIGLGIVAAQCWRRRYAGLATAWLGVTLGLAITQGPRPESNRFVGAAPLLAILAAIGLVAVHRIAVRLAGAPKRLAMVGTAVVVATICLWNVRFYFDETRLLASYSSENTQVANTLAYEIRPMGSDVEVYFAGPPRMWYDGFGNIAFIAPDANGLSVEQPWTTAKAPPVLIGRSLFVFLPERAGELSVVRSWFPGGQSRNVTSPTGQPLYTEYLVEPAPTGEVQDS